MRTALAILAATALGCNAAQMSHEWMTGEVLGAEATERFVGYVTTVPPPNVMLPATSVPVWKGTHFYLLATTTSFYLCSEGATKLNLLTGLQSARAFLVEGTMVRFYLDGASLMVIDNSGHLRRETLLRVKPKEQFEAPTVAVAPIPSRATALTSGSHWIEDVGADGSVVVLDDDSVWKVNALDAMAVSLWLPSSRVTIVQNDNGEVTLVHMVDGRSARAQRVE